MTRTHEELEEIIAAGVDPDGRIDALTELAYDIHRTDAARARNLAKEALTLAAAHKRKEAEAESYRVIGLANFYLSSFNAALVNLRRAVRMFERLRDDAGRARALCNIASVSYHVGRYREGQDVLATAREISERLNDRETLNMVLSNLGVFSAAMGDYTAALDLHYRSIAIKEQLGIPPISDLTNIGSIYFTTESWDRAHECFAQCLAFNRDEGDTIGEIKALGNLGVVAGRTGRLDEHDEYWRTALELARGLDDRFHIANSLQALGSTRRLRGDLDAARHHFDEARSLFEEIGAERALLELLFESAEVDHDAGDMDAARRQLDEALELARRNESRDTEMEARRLLAEIHEAQHDSPGALAHYKAFMTVREEILGLEKQRAIAEITTRAEVERTQREQEILRLRNERLELEMTLKSKELTALAMQLVQKNELLESLLEQVRALQGKGGSEAELSALVRKIGAGRSSEQEWEVFEQQFRTIHHDFIDRLARQFPALSPTELKVCALMKINLTTKEVANLLCCSPRTVEDHRYRIRTKLGLVGAANLGTFIAGM